MPSGIVRILRQQPFADRLTIAEPAALAKSYHGCFTLRDTENCRYKIRACRTERHVLALERFQDLAGFAPPDRLRTTV